MHRTAATAPAMADGSERSPAAGDDQVQVACILDYRHEAFIIVRVDIERTGALRSPVAAALQIAHRTSRVFNEPGVHRGA